MQGTADLIRFAEERKAAHIVLSQAQMPVIMITVLVAERCYH